MNDKLRTMLTNVIPAVRALSDVGSRARCLCVSSRILCFRFRYTSRSPESVRLLGGFRASRCLSDFKVNRLKLYFAIMFLRFVMGTPMEGEAAAFDVNASILKHIAMIKPW